MLCVAALIRVRLLPVRRYAPNKPADRRGQAPRPAHRAKPALLRLSCNAGNSAPWCRLPSVSETSRARGVCLRAICREACGRALRRATAERRCCDCMEYRTRSEEHTSELQSLMRISYAVFCLKKKKDNTPTTNQS